MAQSGATINILSNVRAAVRGVDDVADAVEEVGDRLHDMTKEGDTATDRMEKDFRDLTRSADESADKLRSKFRAAYKDVERASKDANEDIDRNSKKGFGKAGAASAEFKDEALANLSEVSSSFDGSAESIGDLLQGTLGGVAANLPVIGLAAAGAAAAVGTITDAFVKTQEATDEAKESAFEYGLVVAESGEYADASARIRELSGSIEGQKKVLDIATISGWEQADVIKALAFGDGLPALAKAFDDGASSTSIAAGRALELQGALDGTRQGFELAGPAAEAQARALYDLATASGTATGEVDDLGNTIVELPDGKQVVISNS